MSDFETERYRLQSIPPLPPRFSSPGAAVMVGEVASAAANIAVGKFLLVNPVSVLGTEAEGAAGVTAADATDSVPVYLIGPGQPQTGDMLVCRFIDYRWVAERKGSKPSGGVNPCKCTWPRVLNYFGTVTQSLASFYFADQANEQPEPQYSLLWGPRPADIPGQLQIFYYEGGNVGGAPTYFTMPAQAWFSPPIPGTNFGNPITIYFYMWVKNCQSQVMVINAPYSIGTVPDGTKGAGDNVLTYYISNCNPFQMKLNPSSPVLIWGTHGSDDIVPDATGGAGYYTA